VRKVQALSFIVRGMRLAMDLPPLGAALRRHSFKMTSAGWNRHMSTKAIDWVTKGFGAIIAALILTACGGGGDSGGRAAPPP